MDCSFAVDLVPARSATDFRCMILDMLMIFTSYAVKLTSYYGGCLEPVASFFDVKNDLFGGW